MAVEHTEYGTFEASLARSRALEKELRENPEKHKILTGDRPTGRLHIGHYFGSLQNRVRLHKLGVPTFIVIADYQVLTDRDTFETISETSTSWSLTISPRGWIPMMGKPLSSPTAMYRS